MRNASATAAGAAAAAAAISVAACWVIFGVNHVFSHQVYAKAAFCKQRAVRSSPYIVRRVAATIDRPPPPADLEDGDGEEEYDVKYLSNMEREHYLKQWQLLASPEDLALSESMLSFRSQPMYNGLVRYCVGAFLDGKLQGLATCEERADIGDVVSFFFPKRVLRCFAVLTRPRVRTEAGSVLVRAIHAMADSHDCYRVDFEALKDIAGGRYYILGRSL